MYLFSLKLRSTSVERRERKKREREREREKGMKNEEEAACDKSQGEEKGRSWVVGGALCLTTSKITPMSWSNFDVVTSFHDFTNEGMEGCASGEFYITII